MREYVMTIDGQAVGGAMLDVLNPATLDVIGRAPACTPEQLDLTMTAAAWAFRSWRDDKKARRAPLAPAADAPEEVAADIAEVLTSEQGKVLGDATREVRDACARLPYHANLDIAGTVIRDTGRCRFTLPFSPSAWRQPSSRGTSPSPWQP
jgi:acyl-CoA reductase-like NAD-dependent aldehyde dehydrogenase